MKENGRINKLRSRNTRDDRASRELILSIPRMEEREGSRGLNNGIQRRKEEMQIIWHMQNDNYK